MPLNKKITNCLKEQRNTIIIMRKQINKEKINSQIKKPHLKMIPIKDSPLPITDYLI